MFYQRTEVCPQTLSGKVYVRPLSYLTGILVSICLALAGFQAFAQDVKGPNVSKVVYNGDAQVFDSGGAFMRSGPGQWVETDFSQTVVRFQFSEQARDEWSVYLRDESRGVSIQLDLWRKVVGYKDDTGQAFDLYEISYAAAEVKAADVLMISYLKDGQGGGHFIYEGSKQWSETDSSSLIKRFQFSEQARDEWSIYLRDDSRGVSIQLDLWRKVVGYKDDTGQAFDLYKIQEAFSELPR
ncbi:MAG: hypothetical protein R2865_08235 [Deinococcales bacterium]